MISFFLTLSQSLVPSHSLSNSLGGDWVPLRSWQVGLLDTNTSCVQVSYRNPPLTWLLVQHLTFWTHAGVSVPVTAVCVGVTGALADSHRFPRAARDRKGFISAAWLLFCYYCILSTWTEFAWPWHRLWEQLRNHQWHPTTTALWMTFPTSLMDSSTSCHHQTDATRTYVLPPLITSRLCDNLLPWDITARPLFKITV